MKYIITEGQYQKILREEKEQKIFKVPRMEFFHEDPLDAWLILQKVLEGRGNPPYAIEGDLDLRNTLITSLGNLISVGGDLDLGHTPIKSLGNLTSVGGSLVLFATPIKSLGNLQSVGGNLNLNYTPLSKKYTENQIRQMVNVGGNIRYKL